MHTRSRLLLAITTSLLVRASALKPAMSSLAADGVVPWRERIVGSIAKSYVRRVDVPQTSRGDAAAATRRFRGDE